MISVIILEITGILVRLVDEFNYILSEVTGAAIKETHSDEGDHFQEESERHRDLIQKLVQTMQGLLKAGKTPVLVMDGLDKVKRANKLEKVFVHNKLGCIMQNWTLEEL